jgi:SWI/SNF-related matrix-associated actin-dependent regulator 1 of chromatin subfamily A
MTNRYPGNCRKCNKYVGAGKGSAVKLHGVWGVLCDTCGEPPKVEDTGPVRILATTLPNGEVRVAPSGFLGGDLFGAYRLSIAGMRYHADDKSQRSSDLGLVGRVLVSLQQKGFLLDISPEVAAAVQAQAARSAQEVASATARAVEVDAVLKERGLALFPFQAIGVEWLAPRTGALLGDDMGLGKTIQALTAFPKGARVLVIGPAVAKGVWARECKRWRPDLTPIILSGRGSFRWPEAGQLVVLNYDVLPAVVDTKGRKPGLRPTDAASWGKCWVKEWGKIGEAAAAAHVLATVPQGVVLVSDEAHALKGGNSTQRGSRFRALSKAVRDKGGRAWGLTATPLLNTPPELWAVLTAFGLEKEAFGSWPNFKRIGGGYDTRFGTEWDPEKMDPEALKAGLYRVMLRRMKVDVLKDLPPKTYSEVIVEIPSKVSKLCDAALAMIEARGLGSADDMLSLANETRNNKVAFETMSKARKALALAKLEAAIEMIEAFEDAGEPVVVFSAHTDPIDVLAQRPGWAAITGSTAPAERTRIEEAFQAGHLKGVAGTIKAAGVAITLTRATNAIKIDEEWNPALNNQADDRIYRIGTTKPVVITRLVADHALDIRIADLLAKKQAFLDNSVDAAKRGATEVPEAQASAVADFDAAAAQLAAAQVDLEAELARQRAAWEARKAARAEQDAKDEQDRAEREEKQKEGKARAKAKKALAARTKQYVPAPTEEDEVRRGPEGEREEWAARGVTYLGSHDSDHAEFKNDVGFNRADGAIGHMLAERVGEGLTAIEWKLAVVMCAKYHGQIGPLPGGPIDLLDRERSAVAS